MGQTLVGAAFLIEEAPEIEIRDGVFYRTVPVGRYGLRLAMQPPAFYRGMLLAEEAYAKWQLANLASADSNNVVPFPRK